MSKKYLIADDDDMPTMCLKNFLKQEGYTTKAVDNGNAGVEKFNSQQFDLILVDFNLPDIVGDEILAKIKANCGSYRKAVLMSGDNNLKSQFESKGFNFFLHKPAQSPIPIFYIILFL